MPSSGEGRLQTGISEHQTRIDPCVQCGGAQTQVAAEHLQCGQCDQGTEFLFNLIILKLKQCKKIFSH